MGLRAWIEFWVQMQEAHPATRHGEPFGKRELIVEWNLAPMPVFRAGNTEIGGKFPNCMRFTG